TLHPRGPLPWLGIFAYANAQHTNILKVPLHRHNSIREGIQGWVVGTIPAVDELDTTTIVRVHDCLIEKRIRGTRSLHCLRDGASKAGLKRGMPTMRLPNARLKDHRLFHRPPSGDDPDASLHVREPILAEHFLSSSSECPSSGTPPSFAHDTRHVVFV